MSEKLTPEDAEIQRLFSLSEQLRHELAARDSRIAALESQLAERDAEIERLKAGYCEPDSDKVTKPTDWRIGKSVTPSLRDNRWFKHLGTIVDRLQSDATILDKAREWRSA